MIKTGFGLRLGDLPLEKHLGDKIGMSDKAKITAGSRRDAERHGTQLHLTRTPSTAVRTTP